MRPATLLVLLAVVSLQLVPAAQAQSPCIQVVGSAVCPGLAAPIETNLTWAVAQVQNYFLQTPNAPARTQLVIQSSSDFDDVVMNKVISATTLAPLMGCEIPKVQLRYFNAFICVWLSHASRCGSNPVGDLCAQSTQQFFDSVAVALNSTSICPALSQSARVASITQLTQVIMPQFLSTTPNGVSEFFNKQPPACVSGDSLQQDKFCGYGSSDVGCANGCSSCGGLSTATIIAIAASATLVAIVCCVAVLLKYRGGSLKRFSLFPLGGKGSSKKARDLHHEPAAPRINVQVPTSPFVPSNLVGRIGHDSLVIPAGSFPPPPESDVAQSLAPDALPSPSRYAHLEAQAVLLQSLGRGEWNKPLPPPVPELEPTPASPSEMPIVGDVYLVSAHFEPDLPDELGVSVNDRVQILKLFDDDWCLCALLSPHGEVLMKGMVPVCVFERFAHRRPKSIYSKISEVTSLPQRRASMYKV
ncbi:hypothetical protein BC828DRAFT_388242 [Blastocladiella britannica]|nr:hypothetical protein BC828DRAFT_388242 [Blastocladiella britannica]